MNLFKQVELPFEYNLILSEEYKNFTSTQMSRYFRAYCGQLINNIDSKSIKLQAYFCYKKMLSYDSKYIKFIYYHLKSNVLFRPITNFICNKIRNNYHKNIIEFISYTDPSNKYEVRNRLCTLISLVWYKRLKEVVEIGSNKKYSINYKFQRIKNYE